MPEAESQRPGHEGGVGGVDVELDVGGQDAAGEGREERLERKPHLEEGPGGGGHAHAGSRLARATKGTFVWQPNN